MQNKKKIKVGFIGYGNQSLRISNILSKKHKNLEILYFFYRKINKKINHTYNLNDLNSCDIIFICSPNKTHFRYLKKFINKKYIFCEKPPVINSRQIKFLKLNDKGKIFYNYNMRFSKVFNFIQKCVKYKVGRFLDGEVIFSHALATQKKYEKDWRSDKKFTKKGVFEIVSVHALDLLANIFKKIQVRANYFTNKSKYGSSIDGALTLLEVNNSSYVKIFSSYCAPYNYKIRLIYENGIIEIDDKYLNFFIQGE